MVRMFFHEGTSPAGHLVSLSFGKEVAGLHRCGSAQGIVIKIKTLVQTEASIQDEGADHRTRGVALFFQHFGQGDERFPGGEDAVVAHAMVQRIGSGQDGGMRPAG